MFSPREPPAVPAPVNTPPVNEDAVERVRIALRDELDWRTRPDLDEVAHVAIAALGDPAAPVRAVLREVLHYAPYELQREGKAVRELRHLLPADLLKRTEEAAR
jgi:hypothetical protein